MSKIFGHLAQIPLARCYRAERKDWRMLANIARQDPSVPGARAYLLAHPEREIAEVRYVGHYAGVFCAACDRWVATPAEVVESATYPYRFVNEHNALIHPRRAARLAQ